MSQGCLVFERKKSLEVFGGARMLSRKAWWQRQLFSISHLGLEDEIYVRKKYPEKWDHTIQGGTEHVQKPACNLF